MAASHEHKIDHLDQTYYGPPIPPASPAAAGAGARPLARHRDAYTLFCHAFRALTLVLIALGVVALVLWLVYQPSSLKAYVDSAQLTRFDLAADANATGGHQLLRYNLTVGISIRNPNRKQAVLYRRLDAVALYGGQRLGYVDFPRTRQDRKSTMEIRPSFHGQAAAAAAALFGREKAEGFFGIDVKLHTRVRLKVIVVNSVEYRPDVDCYIRVPDPSNATAVALGFTPTQCHVDDFSLQSTRKMRAMISLMLLPFSARFFLSNKAN